MNRELKFRGKRIDNGEWVHGWLTPSISAKAIKPLICVVYKDSKGKVLGFEVFDIIPETVGQFTGLYDKNGKEIYEGDIVKVNNDEDWNVTWDDSELTYCLEQEDLAMQLGDYYPRELEVTGNIHENKELVE